MRKTLGKTAQLWNKIKKNVFDKYPEDVELWSFSRKKNGWTYRIKDKNRAILYLIPLDGYFKVTFVFGRKAKNAIMASSISDEIKKPLQEAKVCAERRGIGIDIKDDHLMKDINLLIDTKREF